MDAGQELFRGNRPGPARQLEPLPSLGRGTRHRPAQRSQQADPGPLPALPVSLPQEQRRSSVLPHPARQSGGDQGVVQVAGANNHILFNPASELEMPKLGHRLPKHVLTAGEAEAIISIPDVNTNPGIRDRAILETLYSTGIRRMEVVNLRLYDIDYDRGTIMVRQGKGQKDRMVPIGERALAWIERYVGGAAYPGSGRHGR